MASPRTDIPGGRRAALASNYSARPWGCSGKRSPLPAAPPRPPGTGRTAPPTARTAVLAGRRILPAGRPLAQTSQVDGWLGGEVVERQDARTARPSTTSPPNHPSTNLGHLAK